MSDRDNIVTIVDSEGNEVRLEILDVIEYEGEDYAVLVAIDGEYTDSVVIFRVEYSENGEEDLAPEYDEEILNAVFEIFKEENEDEYDFVD